MSIVKGILNALVDTTADLGPLLAKSGDDVVAALKSGNIEDFLTKNAPDLLKDDTFLSVMGKIGDNMKQLDELESGLRAGSNSVGSDVMRVLDIDNAGDAAKRFTALDDSIRGAFKASDQAISSLGDSLEGITRQPPATPEGIQARAAADARAAERAAQEQAEQQAKELAEQQAREVAEREAREAAEREARELAEQQAKNAVPDPLQAAAKEGAETAAKEGTEAAAKKSHKFRNTAIMVGAAGLVGSMAGGPDTPEEGAADVDLNKIPLHLMTDEEFNEYAKQQAIADPNFDLQQLISDRMQAQADNGLGTVAADGAIILDQNKQRAAREAFDKQLAEEARPTIVRDPEPSGLNGIMSGLQDFIKQIQEIIKGIMEAIGGGMFGAKAQAATLPASNASANTPARTPQPQSPQPQPQAPQLSPAQQAEAALLQEHRGYAVSTAQGLADGSLAFQALDTSSVQWEKDEIINGSADLERVYNDNITAGMDGGTGGILHIDEDEGLLYINKNADGDVVAYRVNDHINDISNLNDLPMSRHSLDGFGNAMMANDRHSANFNAQNGMIKTVAFDDSLFDGKDLKNEELQFHVKVDAQGRYNINVINDAYKQANGPALDTANGQSLKEITRDDPGFGYYANGKDPIQERLFEEQRAQQRSQNLANGISKGIETAGDVITQSIKRGGLNVHIGEGGHTSVRMGNYNNPQYGVQDQFERLQQQAEATQRAKGIDMDGTP